MNPELIDEDIRRQNWRGTLPLQLSLCADDFSAISSPDPAFCTVSRMCYLPVIVRDMLPLLLDGLGASAPKVSVNNCWLENERGDAVQWHLPLGALYVSPFPLINFVTIRQVRRACASKLAIPGIKTLHPVLLLPP